MKKHYVWAMALAASLSLGACSSDSGLDHGFGGNTESVDGDGQVLKLFVESGGTAGVRTRAGRPLLSSAAAQKINHIDLYVVTVDTEQSKNNKLVLKKTIGEDEWKQAINYSTGGHGKELQIAFKNSQGQKLNEGVYTIYAVGYYATDANYKEVVNVANAPDKTDETNSNVVDFAIADQKTPLTALLNDVNKPAEEIFAGQVQVEVVVNGDKSYLVANSTGSVTEGEKPAKKAPALVLNRQVAGVTGYFTNLPAKVGEQIPAKLRLVASGKSNKLFFTKLATDETQKPSQENASTVKNIINGSASEQLANDAFLWGNKAAFKVYDIDLSTFFPQMASVDNAQNFSQLDLDGDGYVGYKDAQYYVYGQAPSEADLTNETYGWSKAIKGGVAYNNGTTKALSEFWVNPVNTNPESKIKQQLVAGSIFAGEFIIPFALAENTNTFELQLLDQYDRILKVWNVQVDQMAEEGKAGFAYGVKDEDTEEANKTKDNTKLIYNIYRNHMYSMGLKVADGDVIDPEEPGPDPDPENPDSEKPIDPTPKPEPDPDPVGPGEPEPEDKPEDLSNGQDLLIHVNDNWEIIHDMEID